MILRGLKCFNGFVAIVIIAVAVAATVLGCGSTRKAVNSDNDLVAVRLQSQSDMRVELRALLDSYGLWQKLRVPVTVRIEKPRQISVSGTAIMERDKSIFISLKYLGFEIGNLYMTDDSIIVIDKFNKNYVAESIGGFLADFPVNVANVQDLLTGRLFIPGISGLHFSDLENADMDILSTDSWSVVPEQKFSGMDYGFKLSSVGVLSAVIIKSDGHQPVNCVFSPPTVTDYGPLAQAVSVDYATGKAAIDATIEWNWSKAKYDASVELRAPVVSSKYKRISADNIAVMISRL